MVILDQATRKAIPGAAKMFLDPKYPMSGSFHSPCTGEIQPVHINPNKAVKLVQNKGDLYQHLDRKNIPVGNFSPFESLITGRSFDLPKFEDKFKFDANPVQVVSNSGTKELGDLEELFAFLTLLEKHPGAVGRQTKLDMPKTGFVRAIPSMDGQSLNTGARAITDGVLAHNIPTNQSNRGELLDVAKKAISSTGLDYGLVLIQFDGKGDFEVVDVQSHLRMEDAIALRVLADRMYQQNGKTKKPFHKGHR